MSRLEFDLTRPQSKVFNNGKRFRYLCAGRRFGKTMELVPELVIPAMQNRGVKVIYVAPTYKQAKRLIWPELKRAIPASWIEGKASESDLVITLVNGSQIMLFGAKNHDAIRGLKIFKAVIDEAQDVPHEAYSQSIRPALSDSKGTLMVAFTPKGRGNWTYDAWQYANSNYTLDRAAFQFTTLQGGWVDEEEIAAARTELDERTFRQEYEASFEDYGGVVYWTFSQEEGGNVRACQFNPEATTYLTWDFNAGERPMSVMVVQKRVGTNADSGERFWYEVPKEFVYRNTNTEEMCEAINRWLDEQKFIGTLEVTGDYYGNRRESSASRSDYLIIEAAFKSRKGYKRKVSPTTAIQDRVNATTSLLRSSTGERRLFIDPNCKALIRGLTRVTWKESGTGLQEVALGDIDPTDALSYFPYNYHPVHIKKSEPARVH